MTSPTLIVKGPSKPNSQKHQLDVPVSPFEVTQNVDLDDPVEHSRDPKRPPPINRNPARKTVQVRERKHNPAGIHGRVRKVRFPELFNLSRYSIELIAEMSREHPEPAGCRVWINDVLAGGVSEDQRGKFCVTKHPGFNQYWALFELIQRPDVGPHYRLVSIAMEPAKEGVLPPALFSTDQRWENMRGQMGEAREFHRKDFEIMREQADRRLLGATGPARLAEVREAEAYREKDRQENDYVADMLDYTFDWLRSAANYGRRHYSVSSVTVGESTAKWLIEQRNGYKVKVPRGSRAALEMENATAEKNASEMVAFENEARKLVAEANRERLMRAANGLTREALPKPKRTL